MIRWPAAWAVLALAAIVSLQVASDEGISCPTLWVTLSASDGSPVTTEAYLAVTRAGSGWQRPLGETRVSPSRAAATSAVTLGERLQPGKYHVLCSAGRFGVSRVEIEVVRETASAEAHCTLEPLSLIMARVTYSDSGEPVPGVLAGPAALFTEGDFPDRLSPLGDAHLREILVQRGDAEGRVQLLGPQGHEGIFWFEAEGAAPRLVRNVRFTGDSSEPLRISLARGGGLRLKLQGEPQRLGGLKLFLQPLGRTASDDSVPPALLTRTLGEEPLIRWSSLGVGKYRVLAKGQATTAQAALPVVLAEVEIPSGATVEKQVSIDQIVAARARSGNHGDLLLVAHRAPQDFLGAETHLYRLTSNSVDEVTEFHAVSEAGDLIITIPQGCFEGAGYVFRTRDLVTDPAVIEVGGCDGQPSAETTFRTSAEVEGRVLFPDAQRGSGVARIALDRCPEEPESATRQPLGVFPAVIEQGHLRAALPVGCAYLTVQISGFAPITLPAEILRDGEVLNLGRLSLETGAAVVARVVDAATEEAASQIEVTAIPEAEHYQAARAVFVDKERTRFPWKTLTDNEGWGRLSGLAPGRYYLLLTPPEGSPWVASFHGPMELKAGEELILEDVPLLRPGSLALVLDPSGLSNAQMFRAEVSGFLDPGCGRLRGASFRHSVPWSEPVTIEGLPPGTWDITVSIQGPAGRPMDVAQEQVEVSSGVEGVVALAAKGNFYGGRVQLHGEPVATTLSFFPRFEVEGNLPETRSNPEGLFLVGLREPGVYAVRYTFEGMDSSLGAGDYEFVEPGEPVVIDLPPYSLSGTVVDSAGDPVPGAAVLLRLKATPGDVSGLPQTGALADALGQFRFPSLEKGRWSVLAAAPPAGEPRSEDVFLDLRGLPFEKEITLTLGDSRELFGTLLSGGRPVPTATFSGWMFQEGTFDFSNYGIETGADGGFSVQLRSSDTGGLNLQILIPGLPVSARRFPTEGVAQVEVPPVGGRLALRPEGGQWSKPGNAPWYLVYEDGGLIHLLTATGGLGPQPDRDLVVPNLAPGRWTLVQVPPPPSPEFTILMKGLGGQLSPAATFDVNPGGSTELSVPGL